MTAPVTKVTELVGHYEVHWDDGPRLVLERPYRAVTAEDLVPDGIEGKRGRFVVTVEFLEET